MEFLILSEEQVPNYTKEYKLKNFGMLRIKPVEIKELEGVKRFILPTRILSDKRLDNTVKTSLSAIPIQNITNDDLKVNPVDEEIEFNNSVLKDKI